MDDRALQREFGRRVSLRRRELKLTQEVVAERAHLSRPSLASIEAGRQNVLLIQMYRLAEALELRSPADLLTPAHALSVEDDDHPKVSDPRLTPLQRTQVLDFWRSIAHAPSPEAA